MNLVRQATLILGLVVVLVCSWLGPMDSPAMAQVDAGLKRALVSFATARTISGALSFVQAAQVDIQPAGLGVTLSPGQLVAPVNELTRHFADLMLMAGVAFGIQTVLISISGYWVISLALSGVALGWVGLRLRNLQPPAWLSGALVLILMLRFAIPLALLGTDALSQKFLAEDYVAAQAAIDATATSVDAVKVPEPALGDDKSWLPRMPSWVPSVSELKGRYTAMKVKIERASEHMIKLMVIFLLQTLLMPLLLVWIMFAAARLGFERSRNLHATTLRYSPEIRER